MRHRSPSSSLRKSMASRPDVTVLIPTFGHQKTIAEAIKSVASQSIFEECKVVVSDDCSLDETYAIAKFSAAPYSNVEVRRNAQNLGVMKHYRSLMLEVSSPY